MVMLSLAIDLQWYGATPLHVGSGALADSLADKPVIKDADGLPLVPGSSVRGKVRHVCEQIARGLLNERWEWPGCMPPYQFCTDPGHLCPVCRLFGTETQPGQIRFSDLHLEFAPVLDIRGQGEALRRAGRTSVHWSVSLNRYRDTAEAERLYSIETHQPSPAVVYRGTVLGDLMGRTQTEQQTDAALLVAGLRMVRSLGGNRSRGLGWGCFVFSVRLGGQVTEADVLVKELVTWSG